MKIQKNVKLARYTTFHIGGRAEFFAEIKSINELGEAISFAEKRKLRIFILGGGSNILISDKGISGLVLKMSIKGIKINEPDIYAGAGERWDDVVAKAVAISLGGIENLSLIPGTVGGAVYQNIGAYGAELKDVLVLVDVFDKKSMKIKSLSRNSCRFGYRKSIFQTLRGSNYIILGARFKLFSKFKTNINYPDLAEYFKDKKVTLNKIRKAVIKIRKTKLVYPTPNIGTAGSFFKNPIISTVNFKKLTNNFPHIKGRGIDNDLVKLSAGQLIEEAGWKGRRLNTAGVSAKHALVLVSCKKSRSEDVLKLANSIQKSVKNKFNIRLEPEVKIVI